MQLKSAETITILIVDDHPIARAGIRYLLSQAGDFAIVGEAQNGFETKVLIPKLHPKILLLDLKMPGPRPCEIEKWIRENYPETITLILTSHDRDAYLSTMMDAGVAGYLGKEETAEKLIVAIRRAATGTIYFNDEQITRALNWKQEVKRRWDGLTSRERELLQYLASGKDNRAIALSLNITTKTVEFHITNILRKLNMSSRDEAIVWLLEHHPDDPDIN